MVSYFSEQKVVLCHFFIRHVQNLKERRSNSMFVSGFIRIMKHKYVITAVSPA